MKNVHVTLTAPQLARLDAWADRTGLSRSDLIRRAVDRAYPALPPPPRDPALDALALTDLLPPATREATEPPP